MLLRAVVNDIRERGLELAGLTPRHADDYDETGVFYVEACWPWPVDPNTGAELIRFGIPDETLRLAGGRLLRSLRAPRKRTGGQAHVSRPERRVRQGFGAWSLPGHAEAPLIAVASAAAHRRPSWSARSVRRSACKRGARLLGRAGRGRHARPPEGREVGGTGSVSPVSPRGR